MSSAIVFGILAACAFGTANFLARVSGKSLGVLVTLVWSQLFLLVCVSIIFVFTAKFPKVALDDWAMLAGCNLAICLATACLYTGLAKGRLSIVAPVMASYGAVTALLSLATGERGTAVMGLGLALTIAGAVLSALPSKPSGRKDAKSSGLWLAMGAALFYGAGYWLQGRYVIPAFGAVPTLWSYYLSASLLFFAAARVRRTPLLKSFSGARDLWLLLGTAALSGTGFGAMMMAQSGGKVAIATALGSAATAITVVLAFIFAKENPGWRGWLGVVVVVSGIVTLQFAG